MKQHIKGWAIGNVCALAVLFVVNQFIFNYTGSVFKMGYLPGKVMDDATAKAAEQLAENGITDPARLIQSLKSKH